MRASKRRAARQSWGRGSAPVSQRRVPLVQPCHHGAQRRGTRRKPTAGVLVTVCRFHITEMSVSFQAAMIPGWQIAGSWCNFKEVRMKSGSESLGSETCPPTVSPNRSLRWLSRPTMSLEPCANESNDHSSKEASMRRYHSPDWPEPKTAAGEVLLSHNHIALLHGLYDRPAGTASSCLDWLQASLPYISRFRRYPSIDCLALALGTVHPAWATRTRRGRCIEVSLTQRGRAILERAVPVRIRGWGVYDGLSRFRPR